MDVQPGDVLHETAAEPKKASIHASLGGVPKAGAAIPGAGGSQGQGEAGPEDHCVRVLLVMFGF